MMSSVGHVKCMQIIRTHIVDGLVPKLVTGTSLNTLGSLPSSCLRETARRLSFTDPCKKSSSLALSEAAGALTLASAETSFKAHVVAQKTFQTCAGIVHIVDDVLLPASLLTDTINNHVAPIIKPITYAKDAVKGAFKGLVDKKDDGKDDKKDDTVVVKKEDKKDTKVDVKKYDKKETKVDVKKNDKAPPKVVEKPNSDGCSKTYKQCGGADWPGPTCCADAGDECIVKGEHYFQCRCAPC